MEYWLNGDHEQSAVVSLNSREKRAAASAALATPALIAFAAACSPYGADQSPPEGDARSTLVRLAAVDAYCFASPCTPR